MSSSAPAPLCSNFLILLSKSRFRNKRSTADVIIAVHHPPTHHHQQQLLKASGTLIFTLIELTNQMRDIYMTFWVTSKWLSKWLFKYFPNNFPNYFLYHFNFFTTIKSQKSNVWCLKVLSSSQNLNALFPLLYVKCPISILQNSWQSGILSELSLFKLDSKAALARLETLLTVV